jgi:phospholipid-binding lipoprotein MlaA
MGKSPFIRLIAITTLLAASLPTFVHAVGDVGDVSDLTDPDFYIARERTAPNLDFIDIGDPFQPMNRFFYMFNRQFDRFIFLPAVKAYRFITPRFFRNRIHNFWINLDEVRNSSNSLLQGRPKRMLTSVGRFVFNSTIGLAGTFDVATKMGLQPVNEDLGQTFGRWHIPPGPYLVVPILGPTNVRDLIGLGGDQMFAQWVDVAGIINERRERISIALIYAVDLRESIPFRYGDLKSPFEYEMVRYLIMKRRELLVAE